jgi:predicted ATPase
VIVERVEVADWERGVWPYTIPAVRDVARHGLSFDRPVTFLVGENGTGKSTLVEAIAEAFGIDVRGGHGGRRYSSAEPRSELGSRLRLVPPVASRRRIPSYFLRAETAKGVLEFMSGFGVPGYGERSAAELSHGETFLEVLAGRFAQPGFYLLDEPEAPLSFRSCLALAHVLDEVGRRGGQVVCATHSPIITALPGAQILELTDRAIRERRWEELEITHNWRAFLLDPSAYFRHLARDE